MLKKPRKLPTLYTYNIFAVEQRSPAPPLMVEGMPNNAPLQMEVDTGASVSLISKETYVNLWPNKQ